MRLFFYVLLFSLALEKGFTEETSFVPFELRTVKAGRAWLQEDISTRNRKGSLLFFNLESCYLQAGSSWSTTLFLPRESVSSHYRGEIVQCRLNVSRKGQITLDNIEYTGLYIRKIQGIRAGIMETLCCTMENYGSSGALLESLILGKKDGLDREDILFRKAGVSHLLALSGLHRGIITLLIILILKPFVPRNILGILVMIILCAYTCLIGVKHSLVRAVMMYGFLVLADLFKLKPSLIKILLISLIIQILVWPESLKSLSLQLSYLAMGGIIFLANPVNYLLRKKLSPILAVPLSLSLSAQTALFPLLISAFGEVQLWGIGAGIILTPLITLFIWSGMILLPLIALFPFLADFGVILLNGQYELIMSITGFFSRRKPVRAGDLSSQLLFIFSLSVMLILLLLKLVKEGNLVRKSFKAEL